jgi:hypothetical protein
MADDTPLSTALSTRAGFKIHQVRNPAAGPQILAAPGAAPPPAPNLGPLAAFTGNWTGKGFNTIFRPDSAATPTVFDPPIIGSDNVLELNLTEETLSFSSSLGSIPNRGSGPQADAFLNGIPYLQTINDVTTLPPTGIHFEPGLWLAVPPTTNPNEPFTVTRMASIPHGTTIVAQGVQVASVNGGPRIDPVDITPFPGGNPGNKIRFASQTAADNTTPRIPQDLTSFIAAGTITQAILDDPNTVLRNHIVNQNITHTVVIGISTSPGAPLSGGPLRDGTPPPPIPPNFGGGPANIAFLEGIPNPPPSGQGPNAQTVQMDAIFWIETVSYEVNVPPMLAGAPPVTLNPTSNSPVQPTFVASIPYIPGKGFAGGKVTVVTTQIQYTQKVMLNFFGLTWPHVSVATLVPADPIVIPENLLPLT